MSFYKQNRQLRQAKHVLWDLPASEVKFRGVDLDEFTHKEMKKIVALAMKMPESFKETYGKAAKDDIVAHVKKQREWAQRAKTEPYVPMTGPPTLPEWVTSPPLLETKEKPNPYYGWAGKGNVKKTFDRADVEVAGAVGACADVVPHVDKVKKEDFIDDPAGGGVEPFPEFKKGDRVLWHGKEGTVVCTDQASMFGGLRVHFDDQPESAWSIVRASETLHLVTPEELWWTPKKGDLVTWKGKNAWVFKVVGEVAAIYVDGQVSQETVQLAELRKRKAQ